jgi:hypothetical protein
MKKIQLILILTLTTLCGYSQNWDEVLRQELFESLIVQSDSIYISDRNELEKVTGLKCSDSILTYNYTSKIKDKIEIKIEKGIFSPSLHKLEIADTVYKYIHGENRVDYLKVKNIIDNRYSYGIDGSMPKSEISSMSILWNDRQVSIPDTAFANLYQPHLCLNYLSVETFLSEENKLLYIYISGSDGAGSYSVKFVFDKNKYVTRIISTNEMTDGFDFIDCTAKVED